MERLAEHAEPFLVRTTDFRPKQAILLRFLLLERYWIRTEIDIVHRQRPASYQSAYMFLRSFLCGQGFRYQAFKELPRQALAILQGLGVGEHQLCPHFRDRLQPRRREHPKHRHRLGDN